MENPIRHIVLGLLVLLCLRASGQDEHFTQYRLSPLTLNPAEVGQFDGDWRFSSLYRNQWKALGDPYRTISASYDTKLYFLPPSYSLGVQFISDRTGGVGFSTDHIDLMLGKTIQWGKAELGLGLKAGFHMKQFDLREVSFPEQYNYEIGLFDPNLPLSESGLNDRLNYFNLASGAVLRKNVGDFGFTAGLAVHHLNRPSDSFFGSSDRLKMRQSTYLKGYKQFDAKNGMAADILSMYHNKASQWNFGLTYFRVLPENNMGLHQISIGSRGRSGFDRNSDAIMIDMALYSRNFDVAFAYDLNVSGLEQATNNRGAFEIGISYRSASSEIQEISIPCVRY